MTLGEFLQRLKGVRREGRGYKANCPAHPDEQASLRVDEGDDGRILIHCHAGCGFEAILRALNVSPADLAPGGGASSLPLAPSPRPAPVTVAELAAAKRLPADFLLGLGLRNTPLGVRIPYGAGFRPRIRTALKASEGSRWGGKASLPLAPYGVWRLDPGHPPEFLVLVGGESDTWTLWYHGFPALGIPGATMTKVLEAQHLAGVGRLYAVREPDTGGDAFIPGLRQRLTELDGAIREEAVRRGFASDASGAHTPDLYEVRLPNGAKDVSDLYLANPDAFRLVFLAALAQAEKVPLTEESDEVEVSSPVSWPEPPEEGVYCGLAGRVVKALDPHTEADPLAILVQFLTAFGCTVGRGPRFTVGADQHAMNLFAVLVGPTGRGRKGSAWRLVAELFNRAFPGWSGQRLASGLSSGEGLIWHVRDATVQREDGNEVVVEPGVEDKRLLVLEEEFSSALKGMAREGNTLSPTIRRAWDTGDLRVLTRNSPVKATGAHVSIIGHITVEELRRYLTATEMANGFANRFLWLMVRRSKLLPRGGRIPDEVYAPLAQELQETVAVAKAIAEMVWDRAAAALWERHYGELTDTKPGLLGAILGRAEAQVLRLACLYALLDRSAVVREPHLRAALALWGYCERSARFIWGERLGAPDADELLAALRQHPEGLTRTEISVRVFGRHRTAEQIDAALRLLLQEGLVEAREERTGGRSARRYVAAGLAKKAN